MMTDSDIPAVLACDVGNSTIQLAIVHGEDTSRMQTLRIGDLAPLASMLDETWRSIPKPKKLVAASVNPSALKTLEAAAAESACPNVLVVGRDLPMPIDTDLPDASAVGADRLCCAAAAFDRLGKACVVADFGTAITIDCVNDEGVFLGGAILPGLAMGASCLSSGTAQLPHVQLGPTDGIFGKDTRQAILIGLIQSARGTLRQLTEAYAAKLGYWPIVIVTGGDAELVCDHNGRTELVQAVVPDLVLRGVAAAYYRSLLK